MVLAGLSRRMIGNRVAVVAQRGVLRLAHTRRSISALMVATTTSTQSTDFDTISIVPSISMA